MQRQQGPCQLEQAATVNRYYPVTGFTHLEVDHLVRLRAS
jgi:hypothetical protein